MDDKSIFSGDHSHSRYQGMVTKMVLPFFTLVGLLWKAETSLGEKSCRCFKDLVREPDYEGKMDFCI